MGYSRSRLADQIPCVGHRRGSEEGDGDRQVSRTASSAALTTAAKRRSRALDALQSSLSANR